MTIWPITNTLVHTRGAKTEVYIHRLSADCAALVLRFGGVSDVTIHCHSMKEIIDIQNRLSEQVSQWKEGNADDAPVGS